MLTSATQNNKNKLTKQVIISSRLADQMGALGQIYYLARWFDSAQWKDSAVGSGCVQVPVRAAAAELNRSIPTIRSNIYAACRRGYFWSAHIKDGIATIYYKSEGRIGAEMQISEYGARSRIALSKLKNLRVSLTESQAEAYQRSSKFRSKKACKKQGCGDRSPQRVVDEMTLLGPVGRNGYKNWRGRTNVIWRGERFTFVNEHFAMYGASQRAIADSLGRTERTIQRRLANTKKTQLAQPQKDEKPIPVDCINDEDYPEWHR